MVLPLICVLIFPITIVFIVRAIYLIIFKNGIRLKKAVRSKPSKTLIVLGSGGHTTEILRIVQHLNQEIYFPRVYVQAQTDEISLKKVKQLEKNANHYKIIKISRSREVQQSYFTSVLSTVRAIFQSFPLIWKEKPDLLLCNGPGTCIPTCNMSAQIIVKHVKWEILKENLETYCPNELKFHLHRIVLKLENWYKNHIKTLESKKLKVSCQWIDNDLLTVEACLDRTWDMLNSGYWKDVPINYRYCYSICTVIKAVLLEITCTENDYAELTVKYKEIIQQIDKGILLGAPLPSDKSLLPDIASSINKYCLENSETDEKYKNLKIDEKVVQVILPGFVAVPIFVKPSMEEFYCDLFKPKVPGLLEGCIEHWKALHLWQDIEYLKNIVGNRTVPIEIGSRYTECDWTQSLVMFSDFLKTHMSRKNDKVGYLAQHPLFDQIPELKNDFSIPDYCSFSNKDNDSLPEINAWFGPDGTISPLHYDPKNNLLCQVFGYKRIILYSPENNENVYPYETRLLSNTAKVDPYEPDFEKYPNFQKAKGFMCYLKPGDMLFIPPKWWHHVVGVTPSFSVSFWWD